MTEYRIEKDFLGSVKIPKDKLYGAQTQRAIENFQINFHEKMPSSVIQAIAIIKLVACRVNEKKGLISPDISDAIQLASLEVIKGQHSEQFPLSIWQTGSGTQTNMNVNEVIANRAIQILGGEISSKSPVHPNDHVNKGQSTNDTFPSTMHISIALETKNTLIPSLTNLKNGFSSIRNKYEYVIKIGRTHLQDATPITIGQEISGYESILETAISRIENGLGEIYELAQGGTAVGTGLNTFEGFAEEVAAGIAEETKLPFVTAKNKFAALGSVSAVVNYSGLLCTLATDLLKIANDIRLLSSGPRCGFNELQLPSNEPGSSIMPGKVNPTQCEALSMVAAEVIGNHTTVSISNTHGNLQLNVMRPVIIYNVLRSISLISKACSSFEANCIRGMKIRTANIEKHLNKSLMLITCLTPVVGYEVCSKIAVHAFENNLTLREAASKFLDIELYDKHVHPKLMIAPSK